MREWRAEQLIDEKTCTFNDGPLSGVYFITSGSFVKVGVSSNVVSRLRGIQNANPDRVFGVAFIPESNPGRADELEVSLHQRFASFRHRGEWFHAAEELMLYIQQYASPWPDGRSL